MPSLDKDPRYVWRDFVTDGVPTSGKHRVRKADARALLAEWWQVLIALAAEAGGVDLPNLLISWGITGGDENDIEASPSGDHSPGSQLHSIVFEQTNTGPMTLNGKPFLRNDGGAIPDGYLPAGVGALFRETEDDYRLWTFGDPEAVQVIIEDLWQQVVQMHAQVQDDRDFIENRLIAYVDDDDEAVTIVIASTMVAAEGSTPYPHVILEIVTP